MPVATCRCNGSLKCVQGGLAFHPDDTGRRTFEIYRGFLHTLHGDERLLDRSGARFARHSRDAQADGLHGQNHRGETSLFDRVHKSLGANPAGLYRYHGSLV
jgi:hypothetical protein